MNDAHDPVAKAKADWKALFESKPSRSVENGSRPDQSQIRALSGSNGNPPPRLIKRPRPFAITQRR